MPSIFDNFENLGQLKSDVEEYEHPAAEGQEPKDILEKEEEKVSANWLYAGLFVVIGLLIFRLSDLQIVEGTKNRVLAEGNRIRARSIPAPRGVIADRKGEILAANFPSYSLDIYPLELPKDKNEREKIFGKIQDVTGVDKSQVAQIVSKNQKNAQPAIILDDINRDEAMLWEIKLQNIPGVFINKKPLRNYKDTIGLSHILGYIGKLTEDDVKNNPNYNLSGEIGKSGLELVYENFLRGKDGQEKIEVDSQGRAQRFLSKKEAETGNSLILNLDLGLQEEIVRDLLEVLPNHETTNAAAVALDPRNGGVLAMVSLPSFDNNIFSHKNVTEEYKKIISDPDRPLINRAIAGVYPPGSTVKPMMAAGGLEERVISESTTLDTSAGAIRIGEWVFPDWKVHGATNVRKAIAESNDIFFYAVGGGWDKIAGLGIKRVAENFRKFGFGQKTGIDLPGENNGLVPDADWKKRAKKESWYIGDTYHVSIGQGDLLVTPLQLVNAVAAIANGGELLKPQIVEKILDPNGKEIKKFPKEVTRSNFISQKNIQIVREGMRLTITDGSGRQLADLPVESAGKTGTAQFGKDNKTHSWFVSFAPYKDPEIVLAVLVEGGGEGHETAVPISKKILQYYFTRENSVQNSASAGN